MKNKHIIALILSVVISASALAPIRGIRANASEVGTDTSESDILYEIGSETGKAGTEAVETGSSDLEGAANELESGHGVCEDMSITSEEVGSAAESTSIDLGQEESADEGITDVIEKEGTEEADTNSVTEAATEGEDSALADTASDETADETVSEKDEKKLQASEPGGSFETAVEVKVNGPESFVLEDYGGYYLKFTPSESAVFTVRGTTSYQYAVADCTLYGSADTEDKLAYKDSDFPIENNRIFEISQEMTAGHTYYLYVENWDVAFEMMISVVQTELYAEAAEVEYIQYVGKPVTLKVKASSPYPLTYEWRNTKGHVIESAHTDTYIYTPNSVKEQTFTCKVSDGNRSKTVSFHFNVADYVDLKPVKESITADYGSRVKLQTTVDSPFADKLTYQWRDSSNNNIEGATSPNYTITVKKNTTYSCMVTSPYGAYDYVHFYINVNSYLFVYADNAGTDANGNLPKKASFFRFSQEPFTINVITDSTDTSGLKYQWYQMKEKGSSSYPSLTKTAISGETKSYLYMELPEAGTYVCTVTDSYGNKDSAYFDLKIINDLTVYPEGAAESADTRDNYVYVDANESEEIELHAIVSADNLDGAKYSWYKGSYTDSNWTAMTGNEQESLGEGDESGAMTVISTLTVPGNPKNSVRYKCVVKDAYGNYGAAYYYIVKNNLKVTSPNGKLAFDGYYRYKMTVTKEMEEPVTLQVDVEADNTSGIDYGWFYFAPDSNTPTILSGNGSSYTVTTDKPGFYECRFTDKSNNSRCVEFKIVVNTGFKVYPDNAPIVEGQHTNRILLNCDTDEEVTLLTKASSYESWEISYKWFDPKGKEMTEVGDNSSVTVKPVVSGTYTCKVEDGYGNTLYAYFDLEVDNGLSIVPVYNTTDSSLSYNEGRNELTYNDVAPGTSVKLRARVSADNITGLIYEWRSRELYRQSYWNRISGAGSGVWTVTPAYDMQYECKVTDCFGTSRTVYYTVKLEDTKDLGNARMFLSGTYYVCDDKPKTPGVIIQYKGEILKEGTDYTVDYENNTSAGIATVTAAAVEGSAYSGSCTRSFTIRKTPQTIKLKKYASRLLIGGKTHIVPTGIKQSAKVTFSSSDRSVAVIDKYGNVVAKKRGIAVITITTAETAYYAKTTRKVTIGVVPNAVKKFTAQNGMEGVLLVWDKVAGATGYNIYRNGVLIQTTIGSATSLREIGLNYKAYTTSLTNGKYYTYKISALNKAGESTKSKTVSIMWLNLPKIKSVQNYSAGTALIKWEKNEKATGYIVKYTTDPNFKKNVRSITIRTNSPKLLIKNLTKGKTYRFRVCSYRKYNKKNYFSAWSSLAALKIKK